MNSSLSPKKPKPLLVIFLDEALYIENIDELEWAEIGRVFLFFSFFDDDSPILSSPPNLWSKVWTLYYREWFLSF